MFELLASGVFVVRCNSAAELEPARQSALLQRVRAESRVRPVGIAFALGPEVRKVPDEVPGYWLKTLEDRELRVPAMAIVSSAIAVQMAAMSFGAISTLRSGRTRVKTFRNEADALAWLRATLAPRPQTAPI